MMEHISMLLCCGRLRATRGTQCANEVSVGLAHLVMPLGCTSTTAQAHCSKLALCTNGLAGQEQLWLSSGGRLSVPE